MNSVRWHKVKEIFQAAIEHPPSERGDFLADACGGDEELRQEVESLIATHETDDSFIDSPAYQDAAEPLAYNDELQIGQTINHYQVLSLLGRGGMGHVYLAQDTKLGRKVALKILPREVAAHRDRLRRFVQEAQAASALNHPNIITIYEIGSSPTVSDGSATSEVTHFIATEFIDGETLRDRTSQSQFSVDESIQIARQIVAALGAAHAAGIIHRDIKPENVMVRRDGIVKVLDFGLAKLSEPGAVSGGPDIDAEAATRVKFDTQPGMVMGTVNYMSPEQVHGQPLDVRSDIFSFGVVLYEMLTGQKPFGAESAAGTISAILTKEPAPLAQTVEHCPAELQRIVDKCLEKDRERRYQTIGEVVFETEKWWRERDSAQDGIPPQDGIGGSRVVAGQPGENRRESLVSHRWLRPATLLLGFLTVSVLLYFLVIRPRTTLRPAEIKSLAVLPLKSLDTGENYLGLGIADAVIRRISQTGDLTVKPLSAVRRYADQDTDALSAARELSADAVLEGNVQRANDRLRVSVNLLRVSDGLSLWTQNFDMPTADIFTIEDKVSQQVASELRLRLDASQQARLTKRYTSNPVAYDYYVKGLYTFDHRMSYASLAKSQLEATIDSYRKAIDADPNFALAHAQLAYAYATKAVFIEPTQPEWAQRAQEEISRADALDPQLADTHLARFQLLFSAYEGFQAEAAIHEVLKAQQVDPNIGHAELGYLYYHLGLEDLAVRQLQRALEIEPNSEFAKSQTLNLYVLGARYDDWYIAHQKFPTNSTGELVYLLGKGRLDEAQKVIDATEAAVKQGTANVSDDVTLPQKRALLFALRGNFQSAEAEIPTIVGKHPGKDPLYHHSAYDIACIYALEGKSAEAVKWLRETTATGFHPYPALGRETYFNRIRQAPEFIQFMAEMKTENERYRLEFGEAPTR